MSTHVLFVVRVNTAAQEENNSVSESLPKVFFTGVHTYTAYPVMIKC